MKIAPNHVIKFVVVVLPYCQINCRNLILKYYPVETAVFLVAVAAAEPWAVFVNQIPPAHHVITSADN